MIRIATFLLSVMISSFTARAATLYVSPFGDGSDGSTWAKAFHTIQGALSKVPDDAGDHRVVVRPGTYFEANLFPKFRGAKNAYNVLLGDFDGKLGSGARGWVVIDGSCPGVAVRSKTGPGNPDFQIVKSSESETGFKSVDWWCTFQSKPSGSGVVWDRWTFKNLYVTGTDAGFVWDMVKEDGAPFSAIVEDCVGVGRFAGAGVIAHTSRPDEPVIFRRSRFLNLDVWGDAGAAYMRAHNKRMSDAPDVVFEDCTLVSPDNALQCSYAGAPQRYSRVSFKKSRLLVLNFSQPQGTPSSGIICCDASSKTLQVDFEDTLLAGYTVFGTSRPDLNKTAGQGVAGEISFTLKGDVRAYVHYRQSVPKGIRRLEAWPVEAFSGMTLTEPKK